MKLSISILFLILSFAVACAPESNLTDEELAFIDEKLEELNEEPTVVCNPQGSNLEAVQRTNSFSSQYQKL